MGIKNKTLVDLIRKNDEYFEDYVTRSVYHSNAIEGNTLSYYETYQIIFNCSSDETLKNVKPRDLYEAINLKYAMDYIFRHIDENVTSEYIVDLARIVNKNINEIDSFRASQVRIMGAEHIPPAASEVPRLVKELLFSSYKSDDFLYDLADFHIRYERIHPFEDGNGRTGRILLNKFSLANGFPPFVIQKSDRDDYMNMLAACDVGAMKNLFHTLMNAEVDRMLNFGIDIRNRDECSHFFALYDNEKSIKRIVKQ